MQGDREAKGHKSCNTLQARRLACPPSRENGLPVAPWPRTSWIQAEGRTDFLWSLPWKRWIEVQGRTTLKGGPLTKVI